MAELLAQTLEEEKQTDLKLTEITEQHIMAEALKGDGEPSAAAGSRGASTKRRVS